MRECKKGGNSDEEVNQYNALRCKQMLEHDKVYVLLFLHIKLKT